MRRVTRVQPVQEECRNDAARIWCKVRIAVGEAVFTAEKLCLTVDGRCMMFRIFRLQILIVGVKIDP